MYPKVLSPRSRLEWLAWLESSDRRRAAVHDSSKIQQRFKRRGVWAFDGLPALPTISQTETMASNDYPKFSDLPLQKDGPHGNAWGLWGSDDQLGTLNLLTDDVIAKAAAENILTGQRISLKWVNRCTISKLSLTKTLQLVHDWGLESSVRAQATGASHDQ